MLEYLFINMPGATSSTYSAVHF